MELDIGIGNDNFPPDWIGIVVERSWVGSCGTETRITPVPLPIPPAGQNARHLLHDPVPARNRYFTYKALAIDAQGMLHWPPGNGDIQPYNHGTCGDAIAARGYLVDSPHWGIGMEPCECWEVCDLSWLISFSGVEPSEYEPYVNQPIVVDLYGNAYVSYMPNSPCVEVTRVMPTAGEECSPMPAARKSWTALKVLYR